MEGKEGTVTNRSILVAIVASVVTAAVCVSIFMSIFYGTHLCGGIKSAPNKPFVVQISDSPKEARINVHRPEKLIFTETNATDEVDHTITLQDFKRGLQAVKDINRMQCFVLPVFASFDEVAKIAEGKVSIPKDVPRPQLSMTRSKEAIPKEILRYAVGEHIVGLCRDMPTFWLIDTQNRGVIRRKRGYCELCYIFLAMRISNPDILRWSLSQSTSS